MIQVSSDLLAAWRAAWTEERWWIHWLEATVWNAPESPMESCPRFEWCWRELVKAYFDREELTLPDKKRGNNLARWLRTGWARMDAYHLDENFQVAGFTLHQEKPECHRVALPVVLVNVGGEWTIADWMRHALNLHPSIRHLASDDRHNLKSREAFEEVLCFLAENASPMGVPPESADILSEILHSPISPPWLRDARDFDSFWEVLSLATRAGREAERQRIHIEAGEAMKIGTMMTNPREVDLLTQKIDVCLAHLHKAGSRRPKPREILKILMLKIGRKSPHILEADCRELARFMVIKKITIEKFRERVNERREKFFWGVS